MLSERFPGQPKMLVFFVRRAARPSESAIRVTYPSRRYESPIRVADPSLESESLARFACAGHLPSHRSESSGAAFDRLPVGPIRVTLDSDRDSDLIALWRKSTAKARRGLEALIDLKAGD